MNVTPPHIPTEFHFDLLGVTIPIHWNYHAFLMVSVWFVLVPMCILVIRFGKPKPTLTGLHRQVAVRHIEWWWFSTHKYGLIFAIGMALAGAAIVTMPAPTRRAARAGRAGPRWPAVPHGPPRPPV